MVEILSVPMQKLTPGTLFFDVSFLNIVILILTKRQVGGTSLAAVGLSQLLKKQGINLEVAAIRDNPTISEQASIATFTSESNLIIVNIPQDEIVGDIDFATPQEALLVLRGGWGYWNRTCVVLTTTAPIDPQLLAKAFEILTTHHDMLRARFEKKSTTTAQVLVSSQDFSRKLETVTTADLRSYVQVIQEAASHNDSPFAFSLVDISNTEV